MNRFVSALLVSSIAMAAAPASAQRVDDNAVEDAEDAFGSSLGGEVLGLYTAHDVRGFSPIDAGNVRLDGLYFDRQAEFTGRLVEGNRIRVGPSALGYAFPAPTGIADYRLRRPGEEAVLSVAVKTDTFGASSVEIDALLPLAGQRLGLAGGVGVYANDYASASTANVMSAALIGVWRPNESVEITPFWSRIAIEDEEAEALVIGAGEAPPPRLARRRFLGQPWADFEVERFNYGVIAESEIEHFVMRGGLFRSVNIVEEGYTLLVDAAQPGADAARRVIADPGSERTSTSGEISVSRSFGAGRFEHDLQLTARGRSQSRRYGGTDSVSLPPAPYGEPGVVAPPAFVFGPQTDDDVRQWTLGVAHRSRVRGLGELSLGVQRTDYRKEVVSPTGALPETHDTPWLFSAAVAIEASPRLAFYGGFTQGLEESEVAPESAANRDTAPPAIRTEQADAGLRWRALDTLTLIAGVFEIEKPYYGLDASNLFRQLGDVRHRGLEASLTGEPLPGLTIVAGASWLDAEVSGEEVATGLVNARPVGLPERTLSVSVDWRPPQLLLWSFDLSVEHRSDQLAHVAEDVVIPDWTIVDVGARRRFEIGEAPALLRLQVRNLFNEWGWDVAGSNVFSYIAPRMASATLSVDF